MDDSTTPAPRRGVDPRWRALAEGSLTQAEADALLAESQQTELGRYLFDLLKPSPETGAAFTSAAARGQVLLEAEQHADVATWDRVLP